MKNIVLMSVIINVVYIMIWILMNRLRHSKIFRKYDNGNEFYESLGELDKEKYWKEDTKNLNLFFLIFIVFIDISLFLYCMGNILWAFCLSLGFIISLVVVVISSIRLKNKYR